LVVFLLFVSVTSLSRLTKLLNLSPRKLSGVLRKADVADGNGLVLFGFELLAPLIVGYSKVPPVVKPVLGGEIEPELGGKLAIVDDGIFHGLDDACC
jgi:hypothetical protein